MVISKTPVVSSGEANVKLASHLSNLPWISTDACTSKRIELLTRVISKTGACARVNAGNSTNSARDRKVVRISESVSLFRLIVNEASVKKRPAGARSQQSCISVCAKNAIWLWRAPQYCEERGVP